MRQLFLLITIFNTLCLAACGGGGGKSSGGGGDGLNSSAATSSSTAYKDQTVSFLFDDVVMTARDTISLIASAQGTGTITYSSGDTSIATVSEKGVVTGIAAGATVITATVAADSVYKSATGSYKLTVKKLFDQVVSFAQPGPIALTEGDALLNPATGLGVGALTYSSNNTDVAIVNDQGLITALQAGTAIISAFKTRDKEYYDGEASIIVNVAAADKTKVTAWIGEKDTLLSISGADGASLYSSETYNCDPVNYLNCLNGSLTILNGEPLLTTAVTLSKAGHFTLGKDSKEASVVLSRLQPPSRSSAQLVSFKGRLFLYGGHDDNYVPFNDIWSSADGRLWYLHAQHAHLDSLGDHEIVEFNNKLWAIGGSRKNYSDIWSSTDGINWIQEVSEAPFSARYWQQIITFNNKLWLVGGYDGNDFKNDIWSSSDGINWSLVTASAAFVADRRTVTGNGFGSILGPDQIFLLDNKLWLFRSWMNVNTPEELWSSTDGAHWEKFNWDRQTASDALKNIIGFNVVTHNGQLIYANEDTMQSMSFSSLVGGLKRNILTPYADFPARRSIQSVSFGGNLWVIGGFISNDVWSSSDGVAWKEHISKERFPNFWDSASVVTFKNKIWLIARSEIWSSGDGSSWKREIDNTGFISRDDQQVAEHNGQLWIYGGQGDTTILNDIWSSSDGIHWTRKIESAPFPARIGSSLVSYNDRLWLIGGRGYDKIYNDVWSSSDGINWVQETANAEFSPRESASVFSFNNKLFLTAGNDGELLNDIWSSVDGIHWELQAENAAFDSRMGQKILVHKDKLFLIGGLVEPEGSRPFHINDVWSSTNGVDWRLGMYDWFKFAE